MACLNKTLTSHNFKAGLFSHLKVLLVIFLLTAMQVPLSGPAFAEPENPKLANDRCIKCHGKENFSRETASGEQRLLHVDAEK
ncbi:MAG: hypothetical protein WBM69_10735, partial [Desulfobacterales bacterium]